MLLQTDKLKRRPRQIHIDEQAVCFPLLQDLVARGDVEFNANIAGTLEAVWTKKVVEVTGRLTTAVTSACSRCLTPVVRKLEIDVALSYSSDSCLEESRLADEVELAGQELALIHYSGNEIDLQPDIAEEIVMALPQQALCKESCAGLCLTCGTNLNDDQCTCGPPVLHLGLAALKNLKLKQ